MNTLRARAALLLLAAAMSPGAVFGPGAVAGEFGCGIRRPRIDCAWIDLDLVRSMGEDTDEVQVVTIEQRLAELCEEAEEPLPTLLWFRDFGDDRRAWAVERTCSAERNAILLKRFRCYRLDVRALPEGVVRQTYEAHAHSIWLFGPEGRRIGEIPPEKTSSRAYLQRVIRRMWTAHFAEDRDDFRRRVTRVLDRRSLLGARRRLLKWWLIAARTGREPGQEEELAEVEERIEELRQEEQRVIESCRVRSREEKPARATPRRLR